MPPTTTFPTQKETVLSPSITLSPSSTLVDSSPRSPIRHRPTFARLTSALDNGQPRYETVKDVDEEADITVSGPGLGISYRELPREPSHIRNLSGTTEVPDTPTQPFLDPNKSVASFQSSIRQSQGAQSETYLLRDKRSFTHNLRQHYNDFASRHTCTSCLGAKSPRWNSTAITILSLSIYSIIMSCLYLIVAVCGPRYGRHIGTNGVLTSANANLLTALLAKSIEISFATVYVAVLGQVLWRRALSTSNGSGVTLAQMEMRSWVMQPGTMLTRFTALRSSVLSLLGILTLTAAVVALLYTTASEALVQPQLKFGAVEKRGVQGLVKSSWANPNYLTQTCPSPMKDTDSTEGPETCLELEFAAQSYHNYQHYIAGWTTLASSGNGTSNLLKRPQGFALYTENTTVTPQWIEINNNASRLNGRVVNNISMAMPHAGVTTAARDPVNEILQPEDLDGLGVYTLSASVPSPAINVLCANMQASELVPLVYANWTGTTLDPGTWDAQAANVTVMNNKTVVDQLFGWGPGYGQSAPIFPKLPITYNTVINATGNYGREAIYLLGNGATGLDYVLCSIKAYSTPFCSTRYNVSSSGATLEAVCENGGDEMQYIKSLPTATSGNSTVSQDWVEAAFDWITSLSLDAGITDGDASNARLLTQLILPDENEPALNPILPSPAEALAVMAGSTLLMGTQDAAFVEFWNYTAPIIDGQYQVFNATLSAQQYASGGSRGYQHGFYVVLVLVFVLNIVCLAYILAYRGMVTDFGEAVNLFNLAINSPPSDQVADHCGQALRVKDYKMPWYVKDTGGHLYIENQTWDNESGRAGGSRLWWSRLSK